VIWPGLPVSWIRTHIPIARRQDFKVFGVVCCGILGYILFYDQPENILEHSRLEQSAKTLSQTSNADRLAQHPDFYIPSDLEYLTGHFDNKDSIVSLHDQIQDRIEGIEATPEYASDLRTNKYAGQTIISIYFLSALLAGLYAINNTRKKHLELRQIGG